ncbi:RNB domain-containing ribonuclease [Nocardioides jishulii]|uniref:RNB domain-containing ribonuclease n=1 Tax=Nocardioides jishulii TaxID=2575440 RepID=A0A4U2YN67_9ACTN|nr:RNB domain-containing ribonuclease [Nocardioides jishulii]QCX27911.1 RNB domain-containing ribonuclease [Nocardioides jishulii]TKI62717.1 RNB domain-containing ribonuclease [Nocardioides jishulii]
MASPRFLRVHPVGPPPAGSRPGVAFPGEQALRDGIAAIRDELAVSEEFPAEVVAAAEAAAAAPRLPGLDRTDIEFVTIDPPGARDLDQALHVERDGDGFVVHYAIADVGAFVTPGDPVDVEANKRGQTLYGADSKIPLHPPVISEQAGSLLPDQVRPAILWTIALDSAGERTAATVERAMVRSRAQLSYEEAQAVVGGAASDAEKGSVGESTLRLLAEVGPLRIALEAARGGVSLPLPEQEIVITEDRWQLEFRSLIPVEEWNAQISLLTGMAAASLMVGARVGLLRTLPPAEERDVDRLRATAHALGIAWAPETSYPEFVRSLDPADSRHAAMVLACTRLFRGSGYVGFDGELPDHTGHAAVAADYAHVTAPLRRLVDRYAGEICVALSAGEPVPGWVLDKLDSVPAVMRESGTLAGRYAREVLNLTEAVLLHDRVGERFAAAVMEVDEKRPERGDITILEPAIEARAEGTRPLPLGEEITVVLTEADPATRTVRFEVG